MPAVEIVYPASRREIVVDSLHGVDVPDPYRWLEDGASSETRAWTAEQNALTEQALMNHEGRRVLEARLRDLMQAGIVGSPDIHGERLFFVKREGNQNQPVLFVQDGFTGEPRPLVDPNALDDQGLASLDWWYPSHDGSLLAYGISHDGDEWSTLRILDVASGEHLSDAIDRTRYCSVAWLADNSGFFYTRYPQPGSVPPGEESYHCHAYVHRLADDPNHDPKVFGEGRSPQDMLELTSSADGRWLIAAAFHGWAKSDVYRRDLTQPDAPFVPVVEGVDALFTDGQIVDGRLYLRTNLDAPAYKIIGIDLERPDRDTWFTIAPERTGRTNEGFAVAAVAGATVVVTHELEAAISHVVTYADGEQAAAREIALPEIGAVTALAADPAGSWVGIGFTSFVTPSAVFLLDLATDERKPVAPLPPPERFDPSAIEVKQIRYASKDGTPITMFLLHRKGLVRTGRTPTLLHAYGGFNISLGPTFDPTFLAWIEQGGVFAMPNLRGGGEYGEEWHRAGMLEKKQNVFDDFIAAAEWLIAEGYTSAETLAIEGGSNGGLLVGAALTQRPELYRAVICAVPLLDMVRYHHFRIAKLWIPEYGSADDEAAFRWLHAYSPYHHVEEGTCYPATLVTTGEEDSRVDPLHARKMTALLQSATSCGAARPILLRAETRAGHGAGKPLQKRVAEAADLLGFLFWQIGLDDSAVD